jgi:hypothetical protein
MFVHRQSFVDQRILIANLHTKKNALTRDGQRGGFVIPRTKPLAARDLEAASPDSSAWGAIGRMTGSLAAEASLSVTGKQSTERGTTNLAIIDKRLSACPELFFAPH